MQKLHKYILIFFLILSFLIAMYYSSSYNEFIYDLSMTICTSIMIFYFIDYNLEKHSKKEEEKKLNIVIGKIALSINKFYNFFVDIYVGTQQNLVKENSPVLKNVFYHKDELYQFIIKNLNYMQNSPYINLDKFSVEDFFNNGSTNYLKWGKAWINHYSSLYKDLVHFEMYYGIFLSSELLSQLEELIKILNKFFLMNQQMRQLGVDIITLNHETNETFYNIIELKRVMNLFETLVITIQKESGIDFLSLDIDDLNNKKERPLLGELLKENI